MQQVAGLGVTQINGAKIHQSISVAGVDWRLRKDATDASASPFPHDRVIWQSAGCERISDQLPVFYCWIRGVIEPRGALEKPVQVMYIGFHQNKITVLPNTIQQDDLDRMHVYIADDIGFAGAFVMKFLGQAEPPQQEREPISPMPPPMIDLPQITQPAASTVIKPEPEAKKEGDM